MGLFFYVQTWGATKTGPTDSDGGYAFGFNGNNGTTGAATISTGSGGTGQIQKMVVQVILLETVVLAGHFLVALVGAAFTLTVAVGYTLVMVSHTEALEETGLGMALLVLLVALVIRVVLLRVLIQLLPKLV